MSPSPSARETAKFAFGLTEMKVQLSSSRARATRGVIELRGAGCGTTHQPHIPSYTPGPFIAENGNFLRMYMNSFCAIGTLIVSMCDNSLSSSEQVVTFLIQITRCPFLRRISFS